MRFKVIGRMVNPPSDEGTVYLMEDNWNDFGFRTLFDAYYRGRRVGYVKIAYRGMTARDSTVSMLPREFDDLPAGFYSLWPDATSCKGAYGICEDPGDNVFGALNDIAHNLALFDSVRDEAACGTSLLRETSEFSVRGQLHRITCGKDPLTKYGFSFTIGKNWDGSAGKEIDFSVVPEQLPPSNVHALIGRNGIGKTRLLQDFALAVCGDEKANPNRPLKFDIDDETWGSGWKSSDFANALVVSFSPFDAYSDVVALSERDLVDDADDDQQRVQCSYVGIGGGAEGLAESVERAFEEGVKKCCGGKAKFRRWIEALAALRSDPMFDETLADIWKLEEDMDGFKSAVVSAFERLSSGHKAVISIVTGCVASLEERSVVLVDEPENHLHPPLLAAFMRALSAHIEDRNSVAIIATHSPVVLQEVPRLCVWMLDRHGDSWFACRPGIETFGANFEALTTQVFKVEVANSGFRRMIAEVVERSDSYEEAREAFDGKLGDEAAGILRLLWMSKERKALE